MIAYRLMSELTEVFSRQKYAIARGCLKDPQLSLLYRYACKRAELGTMKLDDTAPSALSAPGEVFMDGLLEDMVPLAEEASGLKLLPTFSYFRVYHRDDTLERHKDREACEVSLSLCLGYKAERPWPLFIEGPTGVSAVELEPGDGLLYRGMECPHWREAFAGDHVAQVFLNYVDQNGPNAEWKYDGRAGLMFKRP